LQISEKLPVYQKLKQLKMPLLPVSGRS